MADTKSTLTWLLKDEVSATAAKIKGQLQDTGVKAGVAAAVTSKAMGLAGEAVGKVQGFLEGSVAAYQQQEAAAGRLSAALKAAGISQDAHTQAIHDATEASVNLGFTESDTTDALARLSAATKDVGKATQILSVAQDLARFKNISLSDAVDALTKVEGGSYKILKSLGIELPKNATQTQALGAVMDIARGQAEAYAETGLGKVAVASAKAEEAQGKFGKVVAQLEAEILPAAADALSGVANNLNVVQSIADPTISQIDKLTAAMDAVGTSEFAGTKIGDALIANYQGQIDKLQAAADVADTFSSHAGKAADDVLPKLTAAVYDDSAAWAAVHAQMQNVAGLLNQLNAEGVGRIATAHGTVGQRQVSTSGRHAGGGMLDPGWNLVGEEGPELISPGGYVVPARQTAAARGGSSGGGFTIQGVSEAQIIDMVERGLYFKLQRAAPTQLRS